MLPMRSGAGDKLVSISWERISACWFHWKEECQKLFYVRNQFNIFFLFLIRFSRAPHFHQISLLIGFEKTLIALIESQRLEYHSTRIATYVIDHERTSCYWFTRLRPFSLHWQQKNWIFGGNQIKVHARSDTDRREIHFKDIKTLFWSSFVSGFDFTAHSAIDAESTNVYSHLIVLYVMKRN